jgi:competence protein ComGC
MKHIKGYSSYNELLGDFLNENNKTEISANKTIHISDDLVNKILSTSLEHRDFLNDKLGKYLSKEGKLDQDKLERDILKSFDSNESVGSFFSSLRKFFGSLPKNIGSILYTINVEVAKESSKEFKSKNYVESFFLGLVYSIIIFLEISIAALIIIPPLPYAEHKLNGLDKGKVIIVSFSERKVSRHKMHTKFGTQNITHVEPAGYVARVIGENNRIEDWETNNFVAGDSTYIGDVIQLDDNWYWISTYNYGDKK